jgi:D-lactate dehydrogenase (cytochrome)
VRRLRLVLSDGTRLDLPRGRIRADRRGRFRFTTARGETEIVAGAHPSARIKSATGYASGAGLDLLDLFVGSEGTLAVVTEIEVELVPAPEMVLTAVAFFPAESRAWSFVRAARERSYLSRGQRGLAARTPDEVSGEERAAPPGRCFEATSLEYYGPDTLDFLSEAGRRFPEGGCAAVQFEQEIAGEAETELVEQWLELIEEHEGLADDTWVASDPTDRERLRELRHSVPEAMNDFLARHGQNKFSTDMAVSDEAMEDLFLAYRRIVDRSGLLTATFGHAGQNHLHLNILPRNSDEALRATRVYDELVAAALQRGGVLSAEHGIGKLKADRFVANTPAEEIARLVAIKRILDPALVLGRGTLLPEALLTGGGSRGFHE